MAGVAEAAAAESAALLASDEDDADAQAKAEALKPKVEPPEGTVEWIYYWSDFEGHLPTPINVSITGSIKYLCDDLKNWNFNIYPHKIRVTNTGYTVLVGAKWRAERPYLTGGPFLDKHVFSQIHIHWGSDMTEGSDHTVDNCQYPAEMQVTYFRSEYLTQEEALKHSDGVVMVCYMIKYGVNPGPRIQRIVNSFPIIKEAGASTKIGPYTLSEIIPEFFEDYFLYWGRLKNVHGESFVVRWLIPRITLSASLEQMKEFRKLWNPFDEPIVRNFRRPLRPVADRHIFFINAHWNQYNSLLPIPRIPEQSISEFSPVYQNHFNLLPPQNKVIVEAELQRLEEARKKEEERLAKEEYEATI